ncbi:hypothetical protein JCM8547_003321 [Rhodosporidiobolus lusitaniae]
MSSHFILTSSPSPGVLLVTLEHQSKLNAFATSLFLALRSVFDSASSDPDVRCVVLASGVEKAFTVGLDLTDDQLHQKGADPARTALLVREYIALLQSCVSALQACQKPIVAACHGICYGAGLDILSACDVRLCASGGEGGRETRMAIKEVDIALAADIGSLQRLPKTTGNASLLYELALTARDFGPDEALQLGLVSRVVEGGREEVLREALRVAEVIASKSPIATLSTKHLLNYSREHTVQEGLEYTQAWNMSMIQCADIPAAFEAFTTKKPAQFGPLARQSARQSKL